MPSNYGDIPKPVKGPVANDLGPSGIPPLRKLFVKRALDEILDPRLLYLLFSSPEVYLNLWRVW